MILGDIWALPVALTFSPFPVSRLRAHSRIAGGMQTVRKARRTPFIGSSSGPHQTEQWKSIRCLCSAYVPRRKSSKACLSSDLTRSVQTVQSPGSVWLISVWAATTGDTPHEPSQTVLEVFIVDRLSFSGFLLFGYATLTDPFTLDCIYPN